MYAVAVAVADDLDFNMLGIDDAFFDEHLRLAESFRGLGDDALVVLDQFIIRIAAPDATAATTIGGFQSFSASSAFSRLWSEPGITGMPALIMASRAWILSPIWVITEGEGPMNLIPRRAQTSASTGFSERKP